MGASLCYHQPIKSYRIILIWKFEIKCVKYILVWTWLLYFIWTEKIWIFKNQVSKFWIDSVFPATCIQPYENMKEDKSWKVNKFMLDPVNYINAKSIDWKISVCRLFCRWQNKEYNNRKWALHVAEVLALNPKGHQLVSLSAFYRSKFAYHIYF